MTSPINRDRLLQLITTEVSRLQNFIAWSDYAINHALTLRLWLKELRPTANTTAGTASQQQDINLLCDLGIGGPGIESCDAETLAYLIPDLPGTTIDGPATGTTSTGNWTIRDRVPNSPGSRPPPEYFQRPRFNADGRAPPSAKLLAGFYRNPNQGRSRSRGTDPVSRNELLRRIDNYWQTLQEERYYASHELAEAQGVYNYVAQLPTVFDGNEAFQCRLPTANNAVACTGDIIQRILDNIDDLCQIQIQRPTGEETNYILALVSDGCAITGVIEQPLAGGRPVTRAVLPSVPIAANTGTAIASTAATGIVPPTTRPEDVNEVKQAAEQKTPSPGILTRIENGIGNLFGRSTTQSPAAGVNPVTTTSTRQGATTPLSANIQSTTTPVSLPTDANTPGAVAQQAMIGAPAIPPSTLALSRTRTPSRTTTTVAATPPTAPSGVVIASTTVPPSGEASGVTPVVTSVQTAQNLAETGQVVAGPPAPSSVREAVSRVAGTVAPDTTALQHIEATPIEIGTASNELPVAPLPESMPVTVPQAPPMDIVPAAPPTVRTGNLPAAGSTRVGAGINSSALQLQQNRLRPLPPRAAETPPPTSVGPSGGILSPALRAQVQQATRQGLIPGNTPPPSAQEALRQGLAQRRGQLSSIDGE
jgi:hypothetical protein